MDYASRGMDYLSDTVSSIGDYFSGGSGENVETSLNVSNKPDLNVDDIMSRLNTSNDASADSSSVELTDVNIDENKLQDEFEKNTTNMGLLQVQTYQDQFANVDALAGNLSDSELMAKKNKLNSDLEEYTIAEQAKINLKNKLDKDEEARIAEEAWAPGGEEHEWWSDVEEDDKLEQQKENKRLKKLYGVDNSTPEGRAQIQKMNEDAVKDGYDSYTHKKKVLRKQKVGKGVSAFGEALSSIELDKSYKFDEL